MPMLVIGGQSIPVLGGSPKDSVEQGGDSMRVNAGSLSSDVRWEKRGWSLTTELLTQAEVTSLRALTTLAAQVVCSGSLIGASPVTCEVAIGDAGYLTAQSGGVATVLRSLTLTLAEV